MASRFEGPIHGSGHPVDSVNVDSVNADFVNMGYEAVDRQVERGLGGMAALRFIDVAGRVQDLSYGELADQSSRFSRVLRDHGVGHEALVYVLAPRVPLAYVAMLGALKAGCGIAPLFSAYGPEPIRQRLAAGPARVLVTSAHLYATKVAAARPADLDHVWLLDDEEVPGTRILQPMLDAATSDEGPYPTTAEDLAIVHFTSGTTGTPKGAVHLHRAVQGHISTARSILGLSQGDRYWCTADPGWVTGTSYGLIAPLACGATSIVDAGEFDARRWLGILAGQRIQVWYTSPTALRMLRSAGASVLAGHDLSALRHVASVGEPLNPEVIEWGSRALGRIVHDTWWQTETGSIMIANRPGMPVRPGSMGRPVEGIEIGLVRHGEDGERLLADGHPVLVDDPVEPGEIAIRTPWPSLMRGYLNDPDRTQACFADGWYLSGDMARIDADGYVWFLGRGDDVIKTAGHLIGPFEVESVLLEHPAVAEAGVVGLPDPLIGESICAAVTLQPEYQPSEVLAGEIRAHARTRLGPAVAPRRIEFIGELPHTQSGKILRRQIREHLAANSVTAATA